jgi:hypothetical protein
MFYWYCVTTFTYGEVFGEGLVFGILIAITWLTITIIIGFSCYVHRQRPPWVLLGKLLLVCFLFSTLPIFLGSIIGIWSVLITWWFALPTLLNLKAVMEKRALGIRETSRTTFKNFKFGFSGRGYARAKSEAGGRKAKLCKAFSTLRENHAVKLPYEPRDLQDEVNSFLNCKSLRVNRAN